MQENQAYTSFDPKRPQNPKPEPQYSSESTDLSQNESVHLYPGNQPQNTGVPIQSYPFQYSAAPQQVPGIPVQYNTQEVYENYPGLDGAARVEQIETSVKKDYPWFTCVIWYGAITGALNFLVIFSNPELASMDLWGLNAIENLCLMIGCILAIKAKNKFQSRRMRAATIFIYIAIVFYVLGALAFDIDKNAEKKGLRHDQAIQFYVAGNVISIIYYYLVASNSVAVGKLLLERENIKFNGGIPQQV